MNKIKHVNNGIYDPFYKVEREFNTSRRMEVCKTPQTYTFIALGKYSIQNRLFVNMWHNNRFRSIGFNLI